MKHIALILICASLMCCNTTINPDGTTTKRFDGEAFGAIVGGVVTVGGLFQKQQPIPLGEVTAAK